MSPDDFEMEYHPARRERLLVENQTGALPEGITAATLQGKEFEPVRWIVSRLIPQGLTLLVGKPKSGKSWLSLATAIAVALGGMAFNGSECIRGDVLYAALEDTERRLKGRIAKLVGNAPWPPRLEFWTSMKSVDDGGAAQLREWIRLHPDARLVIVDVFERLRTKKRKGESQYEGDYRAIATLKAIADETGVAIIVIHHIRKMPADDPLDAVSGTTGLAGAADTILVLKREVAWVTLVGRGRDVEDVEIAMEFDREACRWRVLGAASEVRMSKERVAIVDALRDVGKPMTPKEIADYIGQPGCNVRRLVTKMVREGELSHGEKSKYRIPLALR